MRKVSKNVIHGGNQNNWNSAAVIINYFVKVMAACNLTQ